MSMCLSVFGIVGGKLEAEVVFPVDHVLPVDAYLLDVWVEAVLVLADEHGEPDCLLFILASISLDLVGYLFTDLF